MIRTYLPIILLLTVLITKGIAQNEGQLKIFTRPNESIIKVDSITLKQTNIIHLSEGNHRVRAWSEGYHLFDTIVFVKADTVTSIIRPLEITDEYRLFLQAIDKDYVKTIPLCVVVVCTGASAYFYRQMKINKWASDKYFDDLAYMNNGSEKDRVENLYKEHLSHKKRYMTMEIVSMAINTGAAAILIRSLTITKPVFKGKDVMLSFSPNAYTPVGSELGLKIMF